MAAIEFSTIPQETEQDVTIDIETYLPELTAEQETEIDSVSGSYNQAMKLISILGIQTPLTPDPIAEENIKNFILEQEVEDMYWQIKSECEEQGTGLFNNLRLSELMYFFYPNYKPNF